MTTDHLPAPVAEAGGRAARLARMFADSARTDDTAAARRRDLTTTGPGRSLPWLPWCAAHGVDPLGGARPAHLLAWLADLAAAGDGESTRHRRLSTVSSWYRWLSREGAVASNPVEGLRTEERPKSSSRVHPTSPTPTPSTGQVMALVEAADAHSPVASAVVALLAMTGARVSELVDADVEDLGTERGHVVLSAPGKGGVRRTLPVPPAAWDRVQRYLQARSADDDRLPTTATGPRQRRPLVARTTGRRMTRQEVARLLGAIARKAGIELALTPHGLRHAWITDLLDAGVPLYDVQRAAGHVSPVTTMRYDHSHLHPDRHPAYRRAAQLAGGG